MSGEDAPRPYLENLIVLEIKTNRAAGFLRRSFDSRYNIMRYSCTRKDHQHMRLTLSPARAV
jgi:hypothetical protein